MKKLFLILIVSAMTVLSGCSSRVASSIREPDELNLIQTIGIDKGEEGYLVTISTGLGLNNSEPQIRGEEGPTIGSALDVLRKLSDGHEPFYSQADHIIIGEELARAGFEEVLDFIERSSEIRIDTNLFIARGMTARELIINSASKSTAAADTLELIDEQLPNLGQGYVFTALDVASDLSKSGNSLILAVEMKQGDDLKDSEKQKLVPNGFAIVQNASLTDYVSAELTPSVMMVLEKLGYLNMRIETDEGAVGLGISDTTVDIEPVFMDDDLTKLKIKVKADASITEVGGMIDIMSDKTRQSLGQVVSQRLLENLQAVLAHSREMGVDYMDIGREAELKAPVRFLNMKETWQEIFPTLPIELEVTAVVKRTFDLGQPVEIRK